MLKIKRLANLRLLMLVAPLFVPCFSFGKIGLTDSATLSKDQFLGIVKTYHPVLQQAALSVQRAKANIREARGAFDPTLNIGYSKKNYDGKNYYTYTTSSLTIPTWYGIQLAAGTEEALGINADTELTPGRITYAGVKISVGNGLLFDQRRAMLRQAQAMQNQSLAEQRGVVNDLLLDAIGTYWQWQQEYSIYQVVVSARLVAEDRFRFVKITYQQGYKAAIDTTESFTQVLNLRMQESDALLSFQKASFELNNYLWVQNGSPYTLPDGVSPTQQDEEEDIPTLISLMDEALVSHPKLETYRWKIQGLEINRRLKAQYLLPKLDVKADLLSGGYNLPTVSIGSSLENNFRAGVSLNFPLLLREGRGAARAANLKVQESELERDAQQLQIINKVKSAYAEVLSLEQQYDLYSEAVIGYRRLLEGEQIRFNIGESSIFLVNSRENKLLEAEQKLAALYSKLQKSYGKLYWSAGLLAVDN